MPFLLRLWRIILEAHPHCRPRLLNSNKVRRRVLHLQNVWRHFNVHLRRNVKAWAASSSYFWLMSSPCVFFSHCNQAFNVLFVCVRQNEEKRNLSLGGHVGFDSLPDQLVSKSVTQGFCFNILCVGEYQATVCVRCAWHTVLNIIYSWELTEMPCRNYWTFFP